MRPVGPEAEVVLKPVNGEVASNPVGGEVVLKPPAGPGAGEVARVKVAPLGAGRYETRFTMEQAAREAIRYFEQLAGRKVTAQEMSEALAEGFRSKSKALEQRRFGATDRPRKQSGAANGRHIPNAIKRAVWQRDEGRCTFVTESGRRCERRGDVEFDHIEPIARGGKSTAQNLRLRCRAHNQYEAERAFGAGFMHEKRQRARRAKAKPRIQVGGAVAETVVAKGQKPATAPERAAEAGRAGDLDVTPWLIRLGFRKNEAQQAAAHCGAMPGASLEERVKAALSFLRPPARTSGPPPDPDRRTSAERPPAVARGAHRIPTSLPAGPS